MGKEHKSIKGVRLDMEAMRALNEKTVALGNMGVNAKGDKVGKRGEIIRTVQQETRAYYANNPKAIKQGSIKPELTPMAESIIKDNDIETDGRTKRRPQKRAVTKREVELEDGSIKILEDDYVEEK